MNFCTVLRTTEEPALLQPPFVRQWHPLTNPLPCRFIRDCGRRPARWPVSEPPPWLETGPSNQPFDFSERLRHLVADIVQRCPELAHVDVSRLLFTVTQARNGHSHGLQARVTPLRFRNGSLTRQRRGLCWRVQRYFVDDREILYLMTFCLPRFLNQDFDEKFITLFHELYHISPACDGDLRRHKGRYCLHSHSQRVYDAHMAHLARLYLATQPDPALHAFLRLDFAQLVARHGGVFGPVVPRPRLIPLRSEETHVHHHAAFRHPRT